VTGALFVEVEACQRNMHGEEICGDSFRTMKLPGDGRLISVLSDGLGHGVKASILSIMTATMALKFIASDSDILRSAEIIMDALPVCQVRRISYATFTIVDARLDGSTRVIEMGNPPLLLIRNGQSVEVECEDVASPRFEERRMRIYNLAMRQEDRLVVMSDGITQAGMGTERLRLGWRLEGCRDYILEQVRSDPAISARDLSQKIIGEALRKEPRHHAYDDMTAAVVYFRQPRCTIVLTGPPYARDRDAEFARRLSAFHGRRVVCGGTTANIVSRELGIKASSSLERSAGDLPPATDMPGIDLVTEGILTLTRTAQLIEKEEAPGTRNAASRLHEILLDSDSIEFVVGARINEAHQDPTLPLDLEIRRNIIKRISRVLEEKYLKEVRIQFF
jgi:hypothetical protein